MSTFNKGGSKSKFRKLGYDKSFVREWQTANEESSKTLNIYSERINNGGYLTSKDLEAYRKAMDDYIDTSNRLREVNKFYGTAYSEDDEKSWGDTIKGLNSTWEFTSQYYPQFTSESAMKEHEMGWTWDENPTAESIAKRQEKYQSNIDRIAEIEKALEKENDGSGNWFTDFMASFFDTYEEAGYKTDDKTSMEKELDSLRVSNERYEALQKVLDAWYTPDAEEYKQSASAGWEKYLAVQAKAQANAPSAFEETVMKGFSTASDNPFSQTFNSVVYDYRNDDTYRNPNEKWSEEQKQMFGHLYNKHPAAAYMYATEVNNRINQEKEEKALQDISEMATSSGWAGFGNTLGAIVTAPFALADFADDLAHVSAGRPIPTADGVVTPFEYSQAVTGGISTHLNDKYGTLDEDVPIIGGKGWGDVYGLGVEIAKSWATRPLGGTGTLISYFGQGAASAVDDAKKRGANDGQALLYGIALGAFEGLAEKFSIEKLLSSQTTGHFFKDFFKTLGNQFLAEGQEEGLTSLLSNIADNVIMQDKSNFNALVEQYMGQGMSKSEAQKKAWKDSAEGILFDAIAGAASGGISGGMQAVINQGAFNHETKKDGQNLINKSGSIDALQALANEMHGVSKDVDKYSSKVTKEANAKNVGRLAYALNDSITSQNHTEIQNALEAKGLSKKDAKRVSEYLSNFSEISAEQRAEVEGNENIKAVVEELLGDPTNAINERTKSLMAARLGIKYKGNLSNKTRKGVESVQVEVNAKDKVSADGRTVQNSTGEAVVIDKNNPIAKIVEKGEGKNVKRTVYLNTDKGKIDSADISYSSESEALLYESFVDMSPAIANAVIKNYDGKMPLQSYIRGMREGVVLYGMNNFQGIGKGISSKGWFADLSETDQAFALKLGSNFASSNANRAEGQIRKVFKDAEERAKVSEGTSSEAKKPFKKGKVSYDAIVDKAIKDGKFSLNKEQKKAKSLAKHLASAMGINIVFYDATLPGTKYKKANGYFEEETDTIYLDLQNAESDDKTIANTLSHELVHFIKKWSSTKFYTFAKFLMEQYAAHGIDSEKLLAKYLNDGYTAPEGFEEMVANACETMLLDSNAVVKLMELRKQDLDLFEKIKMHILKILNSLRDMYKKYEGNLHEESKAILSMTDVLEQMYSLFEEAAVQATQNYQAVESLATEAVSMTEDGTIKMQMKQYQQTGRSTLLNYLSEQYGRDNANDLIATIDSIYDTLAEIKNDTALTVFGNWQDTDVELDESGHPIFTTSIKNGDYELNQDFSRVCKKRRQLNFVLNMLAEDPAFEASNLTKEDFVKINEAIKNHGFEIACALCFVDSKRFRQTEWADSFANTWNDILYAVVKDKSKLTPFNFATKNPNIADNGIEIDTTKAVTYRKWSNGKEDVKNRRTYDTFDQILAKGKNGKYLEGNANVRAIATLIRDNPSLRHTFRGADIIASDGFDSIQRLAPGIRGILDGWGGTSVPKPSSNDAIYDNSILNISGYNATKAFAVGGVRMNSFSDFMAHMFFDYAQAFADLSAKGLPMHSYTKELDFARLFGLTGGKINMSAIAAIRRGATDLDKIKGKADKEKATEFEKSIAGLDISRLAEKLGKDESSITYDDVIKNLDDVDYVWADESIDVKSATLLQSGILYDNLTEGKAAYCYELIREGKLEEAFKVAGKENVNKGYAKHLGIITVGVSKAHILKLLRDPTIRMVIPYHKSGLNATIAKALKIAFYDDFTDVQNTTFKHGDTKVGITKDGAKIDGKNLRDFSFYDWFGKTIDGVFYDGKATASKYLEWCEKGTYDESVGDYVYYFTDGSYILASDLHAKGIEIIPKFSEFASEENYYKVVEDFDCYDTITGEHSSQEAVDLFHNGLPSDYKDVLVRALKAEQKVSDDFQDHLDNKGLRDEVMEIVKARGYTPSEKGIKYQEKKFSEQVDEVLSGNFDRTNAVYVGDTPQILQDVGLNGNLPMLTTARHLRDANKPKNEKKHHHGLTEAQLKLLPQKIANPVMVMDSLDPNSNSIVVVTDMLDPDKLPVIVIVKADAEGTYNNVVIDTNFVLSYYGRNKFDNFIDNNIKDNTFLYINKKRSRNLSNSAKVQFFGKLKGYNFDTIIRQTRANVKRDLEKTSKTSETKGIKTQLKRNPSSYAPTFYSQMSRVVDGIKMDKIGAASLIPYLKGKGIKHDEIKWSGIEAFLEGKKSVTKAELQEFLAGSQLVIDEEMKGKTRWSQYKLEGGENYRELVFKLPNSSYSNRAMRGHWGQKAEGILVHARIQDMTTADGKKMLFVEELQSDWHNEGREKGYTTEEYEDAIATYDKLAEDYANIRRAFNKYVRSGEFRSDPDDVRKKKFDWLRAKMETAEKRMQEAERYIDSLKEKRMGDVPDAPFRDTYQEYVMKRLLRMAAEGGYDSIGWTPAYIQSDRWSEDYAEAYRIEYDQEIPSFLKKYGKKWGAMVGKTTIEGSGEISFKNQAGNTYKTIREWFVDASDAIKLVYSDPASNNLKTVETSLGWELQNTETGEVYDVLKATQGDAEVWSMDITDSMTESVLYEGQAKFQKKKVSNRTLLANALESTIDTSTQEGQNQLKKLKEYQEKIALIEKEEARLAEIKAEIHDISFTKGSDRSKLSSLNDEKIMTQNRIYTYDRQLTRLESMKPIKDVLDREKELVRKRTEEKGREALEAYKEKMHQVQNERIGKERLAKRQAVTRARESRDKQEARTKLQRLVIDTVKWLTHPAKTDVKCPDMLKAPYAEFLKGIDLSSMRALKGGDATHNDLRVASAMDGLATTLERIRNAQISEDENGGLESGFLDLPGDFIEVLRQMAEDVKKMMVGGDYVINKMTSDEIKQISKIIRTLNHSIKVMSKLNANLRFANAEALGDNTITFHEKMGEAKKTNSVKDFINWDNALPYYAFKKFGDGGESIMEELMDAQDKMAFLAQEILDFKEKSWTDKEASEWGEDTHTIELPSGVTILLTTANAMGIYCLSRRDNGQGINHLVGGGVRIVGLTKGATKYKDIRATLTYEDVTAIVASLTDRQKAVADAIQEFMSSECAKWGNEISMKRFLTKEFGEKFYYPIESDNENLNTELPEASQGDLYRLLNISATKALTKGANNRIVIRNIFDVFTAHSSDMARLNAYGMALLDYMKWLNYRERTTNDKGQIETRGVRQSMNATYGSKATSYVMNLIKDINGRAGDVGSHPWLSKMSRMAKTASVAGNMRVMLLQITAYPRAAMAIPVDSLAKGLMKLPQIEKTKKYCGIALWKSFGFFDTNIARSIEDQIKGTKDIRAKLIELSMKGAEYADAITWGCLWNACEYEVAKTTKNKVGSEEFYYEVGKKLREVVYSTQVVDSVLTRSQLMRQKDGLTQMATAYMSEPTLTANILMDAGFQFEKAKRLGISTLGAWKHLGRTIGVYTSVAVFTTLIESLADAFRDDDEDEEFLEKFVDALLPNLISNVIPFNKLPIIADISDAVQSLITGDKYYTSEIMSTQWLTQTVYAINAWKSVLSGKNTPTTVYDALFKSIKAISFMTGLPISNVMRDLVALWNNIIGSINEDLVID